MKKLLTGLLTLILVLTMVTPILAETDLQRANRLEEENRLLREEIAFLAGMLAGGGGGGGSFDPPPPPPPPPPQLTVEQTPNPRLQSPQNITIAAGETREIDLTIRNIGNATALSFLSQAVVTGGAPFTVEILNNTNILSTFRENRNHTMRVRISVNANAESGSHIVELTHHFRSEHQEHSPNTDRLNVRIVGDDADGRSNLEIRNMTAPTGRINVGDTATITLDVHNTGDAYARNIQVEAAAQVAEAIVPVLTSSTQTIPSLAPGASQQLTFNFSPRQAAQTRSYSIGFTLRHGEASFQQFTSINVFNPDAEDDGTSPNIEIRGMSAPSGRMGVGQTGTISFYIHNTGDAVARNIRVAATTEREHLVPATGSTQTIQTLAPGESQQMSFGFFPPESSSTGSHSVGFNVRYYVGTGADAESNSFDQFSAIGVNNPNRDEDDTPARVQIPRVIVSNISMYPEIARAGQNFDLELTFRNTNSTRSVNNVRIVLEPLGTTDQGAVFTPRAGSNTVFINNMAPGEEVTKNLTFNTVPDAEPRSYTMRVHFDYQDADFEEYSFTEDISIPVAQIVRVETSEIHMPEMVTPGQGIWLDFHVMNTGMVLLRNMRIRVDGPFDTTQANRPIGNLRPGFSITYTGQISTFESGRVEGAIVIYGEDATGALVEHIHDFAVEVMGGGDMFEGGGEIWDPGMDMGRPGGDMGMGDAWCPVAEEMVQTGYMCEDTWEWISLGEWCMDTGAWLPYDSGFSFGAFIRRSVVWGTGLGIIAVAVIAVVVIRKTKSKGNPFDDDDE